MAILFKTYKGKHQLHLYKEIWQVKQKAQLDDILAVLGKTEATKVKITNQDKVIELELNALIVNCRDMEDLKKKFGILAEMKEKFQKVG